MAAAVESPTHLSSPVHSDRMSSALAGSATSQAASPLVPSTHNRSSTDSTGRLLPQPLRSPDAASPISAGLSPIAPSSNGTDIDDTAPEEHTTHRSPLHQEKGETNNADSRPQSIIALTKDDSGNASSRLLPEDNPVSVIDAPQGYRSFAKTASSEEVGRNTPTPATRPESIKAAEAGKHDIVTETPLSPPPLDTTVRPAHDPFATPRATSMSYVDDSDRKDRSRTSSLEKIPEDSPVEHADDERPQSAFFESEADRLRRSSAEVAALKDALSECWTLCNTLAGLSALHRERAFRYAKREDKREQAWKSCWKLCQKLYETRNEESIIEAGPTLDLCREFCQALFEVRQKGDDVADSVLRVSFELNNHLYNTHDRTLPDQFRERTLDFYITLCHRLMKQRNAMVEDTDSLLRACWGLAEMLFSLRQIRREGKPHNEELLGSAVQACWELCDLFREGWTQVRPDRGTPRPSTIGFPMASPPAAAQNERHKTVTTIDIGESSEEEHDEGRLNPETPTTIFEDINQYSPDDTSVPNILVLGPENSDYPLRPWSSSASDVGSHYSSAESHRSARSKASAKIEPALGSASTNSTVMNSEVGGNSTNANDAAKLACLKLLIVRAAQVIGFDRAKDPSALQQFVKSTSSTSFGAAPWQNQLLENYKKLVAGDAAFNSAGRATRASASDVARAVKWMVRSGQYIWLEDLFRWVLGFRPDEARSRPGVWVQT